MSATFDRDDDRPHVGFLRIDYGDLNLLSTDAMADLRSGIRSIPDDVAVLTIAGTNDSGDVPGLTAGLDIREARDFTPRDAREMFDRLSGAIEAVRALDAVTLCGCGGYALGAGLELAMACDFRVATADATLGLPEVDVGIPTVIHGGLLIRLVGLQTAKELIYTGETIAGERARELGLVNAAVPEDEYEATVADLVDTLAEKSPAVLRRQKAVFRLWRSHGVEAGIEHSATHGALSFGTHDQREAMTAFLEDREPTFEGR